VLVVDRSRAPQSWTVANRRATFQEVGQAAADGAVPGFQYLVPAVGKEVGKVELLSSSPEVGTTASNSHATKRSGEREIAAAGVMVVVDRIVLLLLRFMVELESCAVFVVLVVV